MVLDVENITNICPECGGMMAFRKAHSAAIWGKDTLTLWEYFKGRVEWPLTAYGTDFTVVPGGVAIVEPGEERKRRPKYVYGAIGVSDVGVWQADDELAVAGLKYIQSLLWPSK